MIFQYVRFQDFLLRSAKHLQYYSKMLRRFGSDDAAFATRSAAPAKRRSGGGVILQPAEPPAGAGARRREQRLAAGRGRGRLLGYKSGVVAQW